ncbi:MAG TPA: glycosyltransferase family 1 protein [Cellulomonas sp.]
MTDERTAPTVALTVEQLWQPTPGGSGTYIRELAAELVRLTDVVGIAARHGRHAPPGGALPHPVATSRLPRPVLYDAWSRLRRPLPPASARHADVVHATTWAIPGSRQPLVVTVHDLAFLRHPEHFTRRGVAFFRRSWQTVLREASVVLVPSRTTADDCLAAGLEAGRIAVVPHGVRVPPVDASELARFRATHGLGRPYALWVGTLEPRKNLGTLVSAYARVASSGLDLVIVGPTGWGGTDATLRSALAALPADRVHTLGRLTFQGLHAAYAGARVFVFPSTWEGFGMPVLEAMAHGVPVITSSGTSMAEVADGAALLADPGRADGWAEAILEAAGDGHDELATRGIQRASQYSWAAAAAGTLETYERAMLRTAPRSA